jgi:hypothetical protein
LQPHEPPTGTATTANDDDLVQWVASVAPGYRWGGRQGLDRVEKGLEERALVASYRRASSSPATLVVAEFTAAGPAATTMLSDKPMETETFGLATAALSPVVAPEGLPDRLEVVRALLSGARDAAADRGVELLTLRVDADDVITLAAAQESGFGVHEATTTWLADSHAGDTAPTRRGRLRVEVHERDVCGALSAAEVEQLAEVTAAWELNHFHADPRLPRHAVDRFYRQWVHNIAAGRWSDCLFVARLDGRIIGVESEVSDRDLLELTGLDVRVGEWIVVLERGVGAGAALMAAAGHHRYPGGRYHSWETQVRNTPTIRCIEQTGVARPIRSAYTLHCWPRA